MQIHEPQTLSELHKTLGERPFVDVAEARQSDPVVPDIGHFGARSLRRCALDFNTDVSQYHTVLPFRLGAYVPLEALSNTWQRHWETNEQYTNIYGAILETFDKKQKRVQKMGEAYQEVLMDLIYGINMDVHFRPIIPFNETPSAALGIYNMKGHFEGSPLSMINTAIAMVEEKTIEFAQTYGILSIQKKWGGPQNKESMRGDLRKMHRDPPKNHFNYPAGSHIINGIGSLYGRKTGYLGGCFFVPYDVYIYQYASINKGGGRTYHGDLDIFGSKNSFYVLSRGLLSGNAVDVLDHYIQENMPINKDVDIYVVDDLIEFITGTTFNDKFLTLE